MTTQHIIEPGQAVHQAAAILSSLEYINQAEARSLGPLAEAVANGQSWPQDMSLPTFAGQVKDKGGQVLSFA